MSSSCRRITRLVCYFGQVMRRERFYRGADSASLQSSLGRRAFGVWLADRAWHSGPLGSKGLLGSCSNAPRHFVLSCAMGRCTPSHPSCLLHRTGRLPTASPQNPHPTTHAYQTAPTEAYANLGSTKSPCVVHVPRPCKSYHTPSPW